MGREQSFDKGFRVQFSIGIFQPSVAYKSVAYKIKACTVKSRALHPAGKNNYIFIKYILIKEGQDLSERVQGKRIGEEVYYFFQNGEAFLNW